MNDNTEQKALVRQAIEKMVEFFNSFEKEAYHISADDFYHTDQLDNRPPLFEPEVVVDKEATGGYYADRFIIFYCSDWDEGGPNTVFVKFSKFDPDDAWQMDTLSHEFDTMWRQIWDRHDGFANTASQGK